MTIEVVDRTLVASMQSHEQVQSDLDLLGFAASKLWNVGHWTRDRVWSNTGLVPEEDDLKRL
jgi:putative transposase